MSEGFTVSSYATSATTLVVTQTLTLQDWAAITAIVTMIITCAASIWFKRKK